MESYNLRCKHEQLPLFEANLFCIRALEDVVRPNFPNHFGEAEHDTFIDDLPEHTILLEFPAIASTEELPDLVA